jgi:MFS family permease
MKTRLSCTPLKHFSGVLQIRRITTDIPARLDRLGWSRFHALLVAGLGTSWMLDGLEVTIIGAMGAVLEDPRSLGLTPAEIGAIGSCYIGGAVLGALGFGWLTDRFGRRRMFFLTLGLYLAGVMLSAFAWNGGSLGVFRFITGLGIGGEYAAVNSAVDELMPARLRGRISLAVNGTYWLGAALGAGATIFLLNPTLFPVNIGWRLGFGLGTILGSAVLLLRNFIPESPRWLVTHGQEDAAETAMHEIETRSGVRKPEDAKTLTLQPRKSFGFSVILPVLLQKYRSRTVLVFVLMAAQAFLYNALFFTYALMLTRFYHVQAGRTGFYLLPLAAGNFFGPLLLGPLFDIIGRRKMLAATYGLSGLLLAGTGYLFMRGAFDAVTQTCAWSAIFFVASAGASAAYLTASEVFPLEMRAMAIALFYAVGTAAGGVLAPMLFGRLIGNGAPWAICAGYVFAGALMLAAAVVAAWLGVDAERKSLEDVSDPLSAVN